MKIRIVLLGTLALAVSAAIMSCGGGGYGGGGSGATTYTVGGTVTGSVGPVVLRLNGANDLPLPAAGNFTFPAGLAYLENYVVTVSAAQNCNVVNGTGTIGLANITNVAITCTTVVRSTTLTGALQNPPVTTAATGRGAVIVNPTTKEITGGITFAGLTPTLHHIHQAPVGNPTADGPVIINLALAADNQTATVPAGTVLTDAQYTALLAGELYFNVHTAANPGGEIRGQINVQSGVIAGLGNLDGTQEAPAVTTTATGKGTVVVDSATRVVLIGYITHNVVNANLAHIHTGAAGTNGAIRVGFNQDAGASIATAPQGALMTAQDMADFAINSLYFNVHSVANPGGEIRAQVLVQ